MKGVMKLSEGRTVVGVWDCAYCGTTKISGLIKQCPNCGRTRDNNITFYIDDPKNYLDDETAKKIGTKPDWHCPYCDSLNSDNDNVCRWCGSDRDSKNKTYFDIKREREAKASSESGNTTERQYKSYEVPPFIDEDDDDDEREYNEQPKRKFSFNRKALKITAIVLVTIALFTALLCVLLPKTYDVTVDSFNWERTIDIEELKTFHESDWTLPSGARLTSSARELKGYTQVLDHYETKTRQVSVQVLDHYETVVVGHRDNGNGTFTEITSQRPVYRTEMRTETYQEPVYRSEPVYATKYYYDIDRWTCTRKVKTNGNDKNPVWGEVVLAEKEREGSKDETYSISYTDQKGKTDTCTLAFETWKNLNVGDNIKIKVHIGGRAELITD